MIYFLIVILCVILEVTLRNSRLCDSLTTLMKRVAAMRLGWVGPLALAALVVSFILELLVGQKAAELTVIHLPWMAALPLPTVSVNPVDVVPQSYRAAFAAINFAQSCLLGCVVLVTSGRRWTRVDTVSGVVVSLVMAGLAVASPFVTSADLYAYVGYSLLGPGSAYAPPGGALRGEFAIIHRLWGLPLPPAAYGPPWLYFNSAVLSLVGTLHAKLVLLRATNVIVLGVIAFALRRLGLRPNIIVATVANPALLFYFVVDAHNDLLVVAVVLVGMIAAPRWPIVAGIIAGIGASMKISVVVPAAAGAAVIAGLPRRLSFVAVLLVTVAAIAVTLGGQTYFHGLIMASSDYSNSNRMADVRVLHLIVVFVALAATALAILRQRLSNVAAFAFVGLAQAFYPWYLLWGVPYAVAGRNSLATLLISFPVLTAILDNLHSKPFGPLLGATIVVIIGVNVILGRRVARGTLPV